MKHSFVLIILAVFWAVFALFETRSDMSLIEWVCASLLGAIALVLQELELRK